MTFNIVIAGLAANLCTMDEHLLKLEKLCRICKQLIVAKVGYIKFKATTDFLNTLENIYNISVEAECKNVYPKFLCASCHFSSSLLERVPTPIDAFLSPEVN